MAEPAKYSWFSPIVFAMVVAETKLWLERKRVEGRGDDLKSCPDDDDERRDTQYHARASDDGHTKCLGCCVVDVARECHAVSETPFSLNDKR